MGGSVGVRHVPIGSHSTVSVSVAGEVLAFSSGATFLPGSAIAGYDQPSKKNEWGLGGEQQQDPTVFFVGRRAEKPADL